MLSTKQKRKLIKLLLWGIIVAALYVCLYVGAKPLIEWTAQGRWTFIVPIAIAFIFSFVHGNFTGKFWDFLGIKPQLPGDKK